MSLKNLASKILPYAPLLAAVVGGPVGAATTGVAMIARAFGLGGDASVDDVVAAVSADPHAAAKLAELQETNKHDLEKTLLVEETKRVLSVNETMRVEAQSEDPFVRRARPTFMYAMALAWVLQVFGYVATTLFVVIWRTGESATILVALADSLDSTTFMWSVALSVVGAGVVARTVDKRGGKNAGGASAGLLDTLKSMMPGKKK